MAPESLDDKLESHHLSITIDFNLNKNNLRNLLNWTRFDWSKLESVLEPSVDFLEISHAASAGSAPPLSLHTPVELPDALLWISTRGTFRLLYMV